MMAVTSEPQGTAPGCPSGLEPAADPAAPDLIDPAPFVRRDKGLERLDLAVFGAKCAGCISKIEKAMHGLEGMEEARLNLSTGRLTLGWQPGAVVPRETVARLTALGYRAAPFDPGEMDADHDREGRRLLRALAVAGFAMANIMLLSISVWSGMAEMGPGMRGLMHWLSALIAIPAALYAGQPFFQSAWGALKNRQANMDVPISLAVFLALGLSIYEFLAGGAHTYFDAAVMLLFFLLIGRYLDHRLRWRARAAARDLLALQTGTATRLQADGTLEAITAREVRPGDRLQLMPGDRAPVDGVIVEGASEVDLSLVTGESQPASLRTGEKIPAGVLNQSARLVMEAKATTEDSLIAELTRLIETGEQAKSRYIRLADKAAALYVPVVHTLALATFLVWLFVVQGGVHTSLTNAIAVLIITCPCALGLAAPAVQVVATGRLFRRGVLVKSGDALERLAGADTIVFDKTGTLTLGQPVLKSADDIPPGRLAEAASLARISRHPLSRALVAHIGAGRPADGAQEVPGSGIEAQIDGVRLRLGKRDWVMEIASNPPADEAVTDTGGLEVWYGREGETPLRLTFEDRVRADARGVIAELKDRGLNVLLLSGDRAEVAGQVARDLGIDDWQGALSPKDKIERIRALTNAGRTVAMVGDGLNDAPSLAGAHVALSPGSAADASQAAADFVYQGDGLGGIIAGLDHAKMARARILQNFGFAALYNACAVPLAAFGFVTPLIAAIAMSGSSLIVTLNALRPSGRASPAADAPAAAAGAPAPQTA